MPVRRCWEFARLCDLGKVEEYDIKGALDPIIGQIEATAARIGAAKA